MMVIMIGGKGRAGKTTVANLFSKFLYDKGFSPVHLSFAAILKKEVEAATGLTKESNSEAYRLACQTLGSEKRAMDPDYWVKKFAEKLADIKAQDVDNLEANTKNWHEKCVIVDDCRYLNEVGYGRKIGALEVFIAHGERELIEHSEAWRDHESESMANMIEAGSKDHQEMFHYRLLNDKTEAKLQAKLAEMFQDWLDYLQDDDKILCDCVACVAQRRDSPISEKEIENIIEALHKELREEEDNNDQDNYDDREDA